MTKRRSLVETTDIPSRFAAIDAVYSLHPPRLPGDLDCFELAEHWGIKTNQTRRRMVELARRDPTWKFLLVKDPQRKNAVAVLRRVAQ